MDDVIRKYVERALELSEKNDTELTDADLASIARDLGLSDEDLARVRQSVEDSLKRGHGYLHHKMWDDALREFEDAAILAPTNHKVHVAQAEALAGRYEANGQEADRTRAIGFARTVVAADPSNEVAFAVLSRLSADAPPNPSQPVARAKLFLVGLVALSLSIVAITVVFVVDAKDSIESHRPVSTVVKAAPEPEAVDSTTGSRDLEVAFAGYEGLGFQPLRARLDNYPERSFFTLWGDFEVTGDLEVTEIVVNVTMLDGEGKKLVAHEREAWRGHEATLRKGDHGVFTLLLDAKPAAASIKVDVARADSTPASGPYGEAKVVTPKWLNDPPEHLQLEVRERNAGFSKGILEGKGFFKGTWEFRNVGTTPIRKLTYNLHFFDAKGKNFETAKRIVTFSSNPPLNGGQASLEATTNTISTAYDHYEIEIIEFE